MSGASAGARLLVGAGLAAAVLLAAASSRADPRGSCARDAAATLYADARRAFGDRRYEDSVVLLRRAYACDPNPLYLQNVARSYEEANRPKEALAAWRDYLQVAKTEGERVQVQGRISTLSKMIEDLERLEREKDAAEQARRKAEADALVTRPAATPVPLDAPRAPTHVTAAAWIVTATGAAGLLAAGALGLEAIAKHNAAVGEANVVTAESLQRTAVSFSQATNWTLAIGGAVTAVGLTWVAVDLLSLGAPSTGPRLGVVVDGGGLGLRLGASM